jgi:hypothetical protein
MEWSGSEALLSVDQPPSPPIHSSLKHSEVTHAPAASMGLLQMTRSGATRARSTAPDTEADTETAAGGDDDDDVDEGAAAGAGDGATKALAKGRRRRKRRKNAAGFDMVSTGRQQFGNRRKEEGMTIGAGRLPACLPAWLCCVCRVDCRLISPSIDRSIGSGACNQSITQSISIDRSIELSRASKEGYGSRYYWRAIHRKRLKTMLQQGNAKAKEELLGFFSIHLDLPLCVSFPVCVRIIPISPLIPS